MKLLYSYIASSNHILVITMGEPPNPSTAAMNSCVGRRKFLVSYSQADEYKFSTRESFGIMLEVEFNARTSVVKEEY